MKYAVFSDRGKQYKVSEGDELFLDRLGQKDGQIEFSNILLYVDDGDVKVGTPALPGARITARVLGEEKGDKIKILKYKAKSRYRRRMGYRALYTRIKIEKIQESSASKIKK